MADPHVEIDGSFGEGGGQILRTSLALSLLTGRPFHLRHVRARRPKPGLQPQHLQSVLAAARIGGAGTRGASLGSTDLVFEPAEVRGGSHRFDIGTAGATGLVLHTVHLPPARNIPRPQARRAASRLGSDGHQAAIDEESWEGGPGSVLILTVETKPVPAVFVGLGARGKPAETVADEAVEQVLAYLHASSAL